MFQNPRRLKSLLLKGEKFTKIKSNPALSIKHRKQRALNQMVEIKNPSVRENIKKLKVALFKNGIISSQVLSMLTKQKNSSELENGGDEERDESCYQEGIEEENNSEGKLIKYEKENSNNEKSSKNGKASFQ